MHVVGGHHFHLVDALEVGAGGDEPRNDGVRPGDFGGAHRHRSRRPVVLSWQLTACQPRGDPVGEGGFAAAFTAAAEGEGSEGHAEFPRPLDPLTLAWQVDKARKQSGPARRTSVRTGPRQSPVERTTMRAGIPNFVDAFYGAAKETLNRTWQAAPPIRRRESRFRQLQGEMFDIGARI